MNLPRVRDRVSNMFTPQLRLRPSDYTGRTLTDGLVLLYCTFETADVRRSRVKNVLSSKHHSFNRLDRISICKDQYYLLILLRPGHSFLLPFSVPRRQEKLRSSNTWKIRYS